MPGRALLIGASRYGTGFIDLPADRDAELMRRTLLKRNFKIEFADEATASNATLLDRRIAEFCASADLGPNIVYFSGHGLSIGQQDWIIPAGVSREDAIASANQRVPTDLSKRVAANDDSRFVLFILDACRNEDQTAKGGQSVWTKGAVASRDSNFIRLFGCSEGEACHVLRKGHEGQDISLFTKALSIALAPESPVETLGQLLDAAIRECKRLAKEANPRLPVQSPCVNIAGDLATADDDPLRIRMFAERVSGPSSFGPDKLNCLVIESEHRGHDTGPCLSERVKEAFSTKGADIWTDFRTAMNGVVFVDGSVRDLATTYEPALRVVDVRSIVDVFGSDISLEQAVLAAARADLAFFDVSRFEPGVMFMLGVRAAIRRGVTVCSHGWGWQEGQPLDKPFNLSDLQIFSHSESRPIGEDPVVQRLVEAIKKGFSQLKRQPRYQDLPAYDALRELGPEADAFKTINWQESLLMLCSFRKEHNDGWRYVRRKLEEALQSRGAHSSRVQRLIDSGSPQLVAQALYENIRRAFACVMDWSHYSPSAFLELGVRLAVSPFGALQIIDERFLPGEKLAPRVRREDPALGPELQQLDKIVKRFEPRSYRIGSEAPFNEFLAQLVQRNPFDEEEPDYNRIYRLIQREIGSVSPAMPRIYDVMLKAANALSDTKDTKQEPRILFSGNLDVKQDRERAALEYRISAWLYLEYRVGARSKPNGDPLREVHQRLGTDVAKALYELGKEDDLPMAEKIMSVLGSEKGS
jgi:hypothetical protein